jgi:hypothetical protein
MKPTDGITLVRLHVIHFDDTGLKYFFSIRRIQTVCLALRGKTDLVNRRPGQCSMHSIILNLFQRNVLST